MVLSVVLLIVGLALLVRGADWLVDGGSQLALRLGMNPIVVGLTIVAFGTSAPEMAAAVAFALDGETGTVAGTVVGSNIANICLILGITALVKPIPCRKQFLRVEVPVLVAITAVALWGMLDGVVTMVDAIVGLVLIALYVLRGLSDTEELEAEVRAETGGEPPKLTGAVVRVVLGIGVLVGGSQALVYGASELARGIGVPEYVIGLTMVAFGTSLPELATSVRAAMRGHSDLALGNVLGSNVFNLLAVQGLAGVITPIYVPAGVISRDVWIMMAATVALIPVTLSGKRVGRIEGALLLAAYLVYTTALFVRPS